MPILSRGLLRSTLIAPEDSNAPIRAKSLLSKLKSDFFEPTKIELRKAILVDDDEVFQNTCAGDTASIHPSMLVILYSKE